MRRPPVFLLTGAKRKSNSRERNSRVAPAPTGGKIEQMNKDQLQPEVEALRAQRSRDLSKPKWRQ
eukprot:765116-Lingulodinium_polyedra.AAC.1